MVNGLDNILKQIKFWFEYSVTSTQYQRWSTLAKESYAFYDGYQWTQEELDVLKSRSQPPITVNKIAPKVDNISGVEETSRTIISFRPRGFSVEDLQMSTAFTAIAMQWQEIEDVAYKNSAAFKDMLKVGLGWVQPTRDANGYFQYDLVDPFEMVWDVDDLSPDMSNQRYQCRMRYMDVDELLIAFPSKEEEINKLMSSKDEVREQRTDFGIDQTKGAAIESYLTDNGGKLLVVEVQYREKEKFYTYIDELNRLKRTLDKKKAKEDSVEGTEPREENRFVTRYGFYTADILLDSGTLSEQDEMFEYVPMIYKRGKIDGVPYGLIENAKDIQREINKRRSKMMHYLNTAQVLVDEEVTDIQDYDKLRKEVARPDGIIAGKGISLQTNLDLANGQQVVYQQSNTELEGVMGVFDESLGQQTNASSGLAIQQRQSASLRNQSVAFDQMRHFKKRLGRKFMGMIQDMPDERLAVRITENEEVGSVLYLNDPIEVNGKTVYEHDVSTANFDIVVEENIQYDAPPAEAAERVMNIVMNGQGALLANPQLLQVLGVRNAEQIAGVLAQQPSPDGQGGEAQTGGAQAPANLPL